MILIMKILLHNVYKIINLLYPTYVYPFLIFLIITKIECWPVFKQDPNQRIQTKKKKLAFVTALFMSHNPLNSFIINLCPPIVCLKGCILISCPNALLFMPTQTYYLLPGKCPSLITREGYGGIILLLRTNKIMSALNILPANLSLAGLSSQPLSLFDLSIFTQSLVSWCLILTVSVNKLGPSY